MLIMFKSFNRRHFETANATNDANLTDTLKTENSAFKPLTPLWLKKIDLTTLARPIYLLATPRTVFILI